MGKLDSEIGTGWVEPEVDPAEVCGRRRPRGVHRGRGGRRPVGSSRRHPDAESGRPLAGDASRVARGGRERRLRPALATDGQGRFPVERLGGGGEPARISRLVEELVAMLDIEAAAPGAAVRVYAVKHGSAGRITTVIREALRAAVQDGRDSRRRSDQGDSRSANELDRGLHQRSELRTLRRSSGSSGHRGSDRFPRDPDHQAGQFKRCSSGADGAAAHGRPAGADAEGPAGDRGSRKGRGHGRRPIELARGGSRQ